jgi:hypothetical protein
MLIPMLSVHISLTGGSSMPKRKRRLVRNEEGVLVDEVAIRQRQREDARKAEKEKATKAQARRRKGKATRINYKTMPEAEYILVRRTIGTPHQEMKILRTVVSGMKSSGAFSVMSMSLSSIHVDRCILLTLITFAARPILMKQFMWLRSWV